MNRREALKRVGLLMGGALSMSTMSGILGGCRSGPAGVPFVPQTLTTDQNDLVATLAELIIPETDTPGARAARVNEFIDAMLTDWFKDDERAHFTAGLDGLEAKAQQDHGKAFVDLTPEQQTAMLSAMEDEALAWRDALAAGTADPKKPPFFSSIKELTVAGYYTSEIGATQELKEMPVAVGRFEGAVPYEEIGRAWS